MDPVYETKYMGAKVQVFESKLVCNFMVQHFTIPLSQIASIEMGMPGFALVYIETTGGKKYTVPVNPFSGKKKALQEAIYKARDLNKRVEVNSSADELEKLALLKDKGIITSEEFELKKKKLLDL